MSNPTFTISALQPEDIPAAAEIAETSFENDRQTQMKALADSEPFSMKGYTLESMPGYLKHPRLVVLKATDNETGKVVGVCNWGFKGLSPEEMPTVEGRLQPVEPPKKPEEKKEDDKVEQEPEQKQEVEEKDPIKRLVKLTDDDMNAWMEEVMPDGTRCMYIVGINVAPEYQGKGVGSALLKWGKDVCDDKGIFAWVHSSELAWRMYQKVGFEIIRTLDVDLDKYAPCPPPNEGEGAKWGHYVFRYMKYYGKKA